MKDKITLMFEVDGDVEDVKKTYDISKAVSEYVSKFPGLKLMNVAVHYDWNKEQKVKQSPEFLKANPDYGKPKPKEEPIYGRNFIHCAWIDKSNRECNMTIKVKRKGKEGQGMSSVSMQDIASEDTWKNIKNGGKNGNGKAKGRK